MDEYERLYREAVGLIRPYLRLTDRAPQPVSTPADVEALERGIAHLINGDVDQARATCARALLLGPKDRITQRLSQVIREVQEKRRPVPQRLGDL